MAYSVYVIYSVLLDSFYKGQTEDLKSRLNRHNKGSEKATKTGIPWILIWSTQKETRSESVILERKLKNLSRKKLIAFIKKYKEGIAGPDALTLLSQWSGC